MRSKAYKAKDNEHRSPKDLFQASLVLTDGVMVLVGEGGMCKEHKEVIVGKVQRVNRVLQM